MPTYDYRCAECGYEFEKFQQITASPLRKCPECGKMTLKRLIGTGAGAIFKGSGFYETDYRSESYKEGEKKAAEKKSEKKSGKDSAKSEKTSSSQSKSQSSKPADTKSA
ncbi:FmdB family zinc ribbon protein [Sedimentisphaera salicampi]|uniref:Putative regulatory protein, FmdB family n=1 Tax=Sedimentisphaera salicampi TaxID=1941349 RepID=A0A1W6LP33_9BACT|nr:zinc ribbon domain-containing protein [Sedimentisphaera salicampi]ARN57527.1 putative regulatory protein, FmdB family [Sedimentisphaera salicampi]OXU14389.1 putative regulatory protein, FmdB family [Sedimentisphaera salicampi]